MKKLSKAALHAAAATNAEVVPRPGTVSMALAADLSGDDVDRVREQIRAMTAAPDPADILWASPAVSPPWAYNHRPLSHYCQGSDKVRTPGPKSFGQQGCFAVATEVVTSSTGYRLYYCTRHAALHRRYEATEHSAASADVQEFREPAGYDGSSWGSDEVGTWIGAELARCIEELYEFPRGIDALDEGK
jgi:hypothetical protein